MALPDTITQSKKALRAKCVLHTGPDVGRITTFDSLEAAVLKMIKWLKEIEAKKGIKI